MAGATSLTYGDVTFKDIETKDFSVRAQYDSTGTDLLFHLWRIKVECVLHIEDTTIHGPSLQGATIQETFQKVRRAMLEPRKPFSYTGEQSYLSVTPYPPGTAKTSLEGRDVDNGPKPREFRITKVINDKILRCEFEIECATIECAELNNTSGVLSNRWSMEDMRDENHYLTRTYRGKLRVASSNINPHAFRVYGVPALLRGFKRKSIRFSSTPDGLELEYEVVDRQVSNACPLPGTTWSYEHTERVTEGLLCIGSIRLQIDGPPNLKKSSLLAFAAKVVIERMRFEEKGKSPGEVTDFYVTDIGQEDAQRVAMGMTVRRSASATFDIAGLEATKIGQPVEIDGYDRLQTNPPDLYDKANPTAGILLSYLQSPCDEEHRIPQEEIEPPEEEDEETGGTGVDVTLEESGFLNVSANDQASSEHKQATYTEYRLEREYKARQNNLQLPFGKASEEGEDTCVIANLMLPTGRTVIRAEAARVGAPPKMPAPQEFDDSNGIHYTPIGEPEFLVMPPELTADGAKKRYVMQVEYTYAMSRPIALSETFDFGSLPWDISSRAENQVAGSNLFDTDTIA